jgi:hypothetical protein
MLTSKWKYQEPKRTEQSSFSNPVTAEIAVTSSLTSGNIVSNTVQSQTIISSSAKTWSKHTKDSKRQ